MTKLFLISYKSDANFNAAIFHNYINSMYANGSIADWWHYTDNVYIVATTHTANELYNITFPGVPRRYLLVIEVNQNNAQGWLPKEAWTWLQKYQQK